MKKNKTLKIFGIILLSMIILSTIFLIGRKDEISIINSVKEINDNDVYYCEISSDLHINEYLKNGAKSTSELLSFLKKKYYGIGCDINNSTKSCSSFFATTPNGDYIVGHNIDNKTAVPCVAKITNGPDIIGIGNALGMISSNNKSIFNKYNLNFIPYCLFGGMNEFGLCIVGATDGYSYSTIDCEKTTIMDCTVNISALYNAKTVDEAYEILKKYNIINGTNPLTHFMCADSQGNASVFENQGTLLEKKKDKNYQIMTNFNLLNNPFLEGFGKDRYDNYEQLLINSLGIISEDDAMQLLLNNTIEEDECFSAIYNLSKKTLKIAFQPYTNDIKTFSFEE